MLHLVRKRQVNAAFKNDWMKNQATKVPPLLANGTRVLIYAGEVDFICNWLGNQAWTQAMKWPHQGEYNTTKPIGWKVDGKEAGTMQSSHNFTFLRVYDAGHMVPRDQPAVAQAMIEAFTAGQL